jgi:hypothetical protein
VKICVNLVARITGKLLDGRSEQFWENGQSKKLLGLLKSPYFIQDTDDYEAISLVTDIIQVGAW